MSNDLKFYINGEWVNSDSSELIDVINPANEEIIGQITAGTKEDINSAVDAASEAFISFSKSSKEERIDLLKNIIKEYENRYEDLAKIINQELKIIKQKFSDKGMEATITRSIVRYILKNALQKDLHARDIKNLVKEIVRVPLSHFLIKHKVNQKITLSSDKEEITFSV